MQSGAQKRKDRVARGLPRYTPAEALSRKQANKRQKAANSVKALAHTQAIKVLTGCADCGYSDHAEALEFDHLPEHQKVRSVSRMVQDGASIAAIDSEIAKCEVVCANCHAVRTHARRTHA
jgi:hypothetical protein